MKPSRVSGLSLLALAVLIALGIYAAGNGWFVNAADPGVIEGKALPDSAVQTKVQRTAKAASAQGEASERQILFGDLHVHTTYSLDAFLISLPILSGSGMHPIADACDFARYCSALDFWSINDHAEAFTQKQWTETKESIRQCNNLASDPANPDMVSFLGWEWTQAGAVPEEHYGHKNVILRDTDDDKVPVRPIGSIGIGSNSVFRGIPFWGRALSVIAAPGGQRLHWLRWADFNRSVVTGTTPCEKNVPVRALPDDCRENVATPAELFTKLNDWGFDNIVIPHGTTWGFYSPLGAKLDKQLDDAQNDPNLQTLLEIHSGHGNSEEYRSWREIDYTTTGEKICPQPRDNYTPACWRAGEIIGERCRAADMENAECESRVRQAQQNYLEFGISGFLTVPGASAEDWLDAGQCQDCFLPAYHYRPKGSAQYALALTDFDNPSGYRNFRFGFISSSDNHYSRPGTGYKEFSRKGHTEANGRPSADIPQVDVTRITVTGLKKTPSSRRPDISQYAGFTRMETERLASYFTTGGLAVVHSENRSREKIWAALKRKEVYATSGDRILLWFNAHTANATHPMGAEVQAARSPKFEVKAVGAFMQKPGCPDYALQGLTKERLELLCKGECYNPSDVRKHITRIEVVRVLPQSYPDEPVDGLIQDPWRVHECPADSSGCQFEFTDPEYGAMKRPATYYVRAIEEPSLAVNGDSLRCEYDEQGRCIKTTPCYGDFRTGNDDDCRAMVEERAWSSPIYLVP